MPSSPFFRAPGGGIQAPGFLSFGVQGGSELLKVSASDGATFIGSDGRQHGTFEFDDSATATIVVFASVHASDTITFLTQGALTARDLAVFTDVAVSLEVSPGSAAPTASSQATFTGVAVGVRLARGTVFAADTARFHDMASESLGSIVFTDHASVAVSSSSQIHFESAADSARFHDTAILVVIGAHGGRVASDNILFRDGAFVSDTADQFPLDAMDCAIFCDLAYRDRDLPEAAFDQFWFRERACGAIGGTASDSAKFSDQAVAAYYMGRHRLGDQVGLMLSVPSPPDSSPIAVIFDAFNRQVAAFSIPAVTTDLTRFGFPLFIGNQYAIGRFTVYFHYVVNGAPSLRGATFDVVDGGDSEGAVISLHGVDRPEARSILVQVTGGRLLAGSNPGLN